MLRIVMPFAFLLLLAIGTVAQEAPANPEFESIITRQIEAFRADNGEAAYGFAAPAIRRIFPTPEIFMQMVRQGYRPVYRPQSFAFAGVFTDPMGRPAQRVTIVGPDGRSYEAIYAMERQPDGRWLIVGCTLVEIPGLNT